MRQNLKKKKSITHVFTQPITLDATSQLFGMCVILIIVLYHKLVYSNRQRVVLIFFLRDYPVRLYNKFLRIKVNWIFTCFLLLNVTFVFAQKQNYSSFEVHICNSFILCHTERYRLFHFNYWQNLFLPNILLDP